MNKDFQTTQQEERDALQVKFEAAANGEYPARCLVCLNPAEKPNPDGICSSCLEQKPFDVEASHAIPQAVPTPEELLNDPCTPFWASDVIRVALSKDCCDAAGVLEVLAECFSARANRIAKGGR